MTLTLYLEHYPARHGMSPAPGMDARAALGCRHPPVEREGNPPGNVYHSLLQSSLPWVILAVGNR